MVSRRVTALEREVGGALFERTSRRVRLTPLGEQLRDRFQPAYHEIYAALTDASTSAKQIGGFLKVGVTATTAMPALTASSKPSEIRTPTAKFPSMRSRSGTP